MPSYGKAKAAKKRTTGAKAKAGTARKKTIPSEVQSFLDKLPVIAEAEAIPFTQKEWLKLLADFKAPRKPTSGEMKGNLAKDREWRRQQAKEFAEWEARYDSAERRRRNAVAVRQAKGRAFAALADLLEVAMHPNTLEDFATARVGEIIAEGLDCLAEIGASASPAATRARGALDEIKRRLKRAGDLEAKRRQRERQRGGKSPRSWSKDLTRLVDELVAEVRVAHEAGARKFKGVDLPEWPFGGAYGDDALGRAVRAEWTVAMMRLVDEVVALRLEALGAFDSDKWCDRQRDQARREIKRCWQREAARRRTEHREWVEQGMVG